MATITHGTNTSYKRGCRCRPCTDAAAAAQKSYYRRRGYNGGRRLTLTGDDADRVRRRIDTLNAMGWTLRQIGQAAGLSNAHLSRLASGQKNPRRDTAARVDQAWDQLTSTSPGMVPKRWAGRQNRRIIPHYRDTSTGVELDTPAWADRIRAELNAALDEGARISHIADGAGLHGSRLQAFLTTGETPTEKALYRLDDWLTRQGRTVA